MATTRFTRQHTQSRLTSLHRREETGRARWALESGRGKTPPRITPAAPGHPPTIYTPLRTPTGRPTARARRPREPSGAGPSARRPRPAPSHPLALARALSRPPAATVGPARAAVRAAGSLLRARLRAPRESWFRRPSSPGDSTQESGGDGGASQGPGPAGLAPAPQARACQGARGLPLPTASPTARRAGRKAGRTNQETPSRLSGPRLPSGAPTPPSSSLALLPPPPQKRRCPTAAPRPPLPHSPRPARPSTHSRSYRPAPPLRRRPVTRWGRKTGGARAIDAAQSEQSTGASDAAQSE
ncbi:uncharacterized protein [Equus przewalskii]|uniref:Uncharacterized protein n=1 Tax=Equus przewalskii TaxID=9798 RepID=A0ABM4NM54_EQUPR